MSTETQQQDDPTSEVHAAATAARAPAMPARS